LWPFHDRVLGLDHHRTERRSVGIVDPCVIHGDPEVSGGTIRFHCRVGFFQSSSHGFLPLVEAKEHLGGRSLLLIEQAAVLSVTRQTSEDLAFVRSFIGQVEDSPALQPVEGFDFARKGHPLGLGKALYFPSGKS
jgi:hypothetical protein